MVGIVTSIPKPLMFFPINFIVLTMIFFAIVFPMEHALRYIGLFWLVNSSDYNFFKKVKFTNAFWLGTIDDPFLEEFYKEFVLATYTDRPLPQQDLALLREFQILRCPQLQ